MLIKAYLKSAMFHLPIEHTELVKQVAEKLYPNKTLVNSAIGKLYPIQKIEGNEKIIIEKQKTNIFLLNFLLSVMYEHNQEIEEENFYSDSFIIERLEDLTKLDLSNGYEDLEDKLTSYLKDYTSSTTEETLPFTSDNEQASNTLEIEQEESDTRDTSDTSDTFTKVKFNMDWVKQAHNKLK